MTTKVYIRYQEPSDIPGLRWKNKGKPIMIGEVDASKTGSAEETFVSTEVNVSAKLTEQFVGRELFVTALVALNAHDENLWDAETMIDGRNHLNPDANETGGAIGSFKIGNRERFLVIAETKRVIIDKK